MQRLSTDNIIVISQIFCASLSPSSHVIEVHSQPENDWILKLSMLSHRPILNPFYCLLLGYRLIFYANLFFRHLRTFSKLPLQNRFISKMLKY